MLAAAQSESVSYRYDERNRVIEVAYANAVIRYTYDASGNRLTVRTEILGQTTEPPSNIGPNFSVAAPAILDTFTAPDGTLLAAHAADVNAPQSMWSSAHSPGPVLLGGRLRVTQSRPDLDVAVIDAHAADVMVMTDWVVPSGPSVWAGVVIRYRNPENYLLVRYWAGELALFRRQGGEFVALGSAEVPVAAGSIHQIGVSARGTLLHVMWDGVVRLQATEPSEQDATSHGLAWASSVDLDTAFDNFVVASALPDDPDDDPTPIPPVTGAVLSVDLPSPQVSGTTVTLAASGIGGAAPREFKWWLWNGTAWSVLRDWSAAPILTWSPTVPGQYLVAIWARSNGATADAAQALAQIPFVVVPPGATAPVRSVTLAADAVSPQPIGTPITFTAGATGGVQPYEFKWWLWNGSKWLIAQEWSSNTTFTWTPTVAGLHAVAVWARSAGVTADVAQALAHADYVVSDPNAVPPVATAQLSVDRPSPQTAGTRVTFEASGTGGVAPRQFKWWLWDDVMWTILRDWSADPTLAWTPLVARSYRVAIWARSHGVSDDVAQVLAQTEYVITAPAMITPVQSAQLTADLPSPQVAGTAVTFTARAIGGVAPQQFKWWVWNGSVWQVLRDWNASDTLTWAPTAPAGYAVAIWARSNGVVADAAQAWAQMPYTITTPDIPAVTSASLTPSVASPQVAGTPITFTASATGGQAPHEFKWWEWDGVRWRVLRDWSSSDSLVWVPTDAYTYRVAIWARSNGVSTDAAQALAQTTYVIEVAGAIPPVTSASLSADRPSPQIAGVPITFSAAAVGGRAPHEFKWWLRVGMTWTVLREWNANATFTWTSTIPGSYLVAIWARSNGATTDAAQALAQMPYAISEPGVVSPVTGASLTANLPSPQSAGTPVTFMAAAVGGLAPQQFKFWLWDGIAWRVIGDWNTQPTLTWVPDTAGTYLVAIWARSNGVTADAAQALAQVSYTITGNGSGPVTSATLTMDRASPQPAGTSITFTANATDGQAPRQFKWWLWDGVAWRVLREWSTAVDLTWRPGTPGTYVVAFWARSSGATADEAQALAQTAYVVIP